jgi:hypothetical protein
MDTTTLVTAYFSIPSKHTTAEYAEWMKNMLSLHDAMVIFTSPELVDTLAGHRGEFMGRTKIIAVSLPDLRAATYKDTAFWERQNALDPSKHLRQDYRLYWIWLSKVDFVAKAAELAPFRSRFYFWVDIGSFRNKDWNGKQLVTTLQFLHGDAVFLVKSPIAPHAEGQLVTCVKICEPYVAGSSFGGTAAAVVALWTAFYDTVDFMVAKGWFVGEDQIVFWNMCLRNPGLCTLAKSPKMGVQDVWFGFKEIYHGDVAPMLAEPAPRQRHAVVTMVTTLEYVIGANVLLHSLRKRNTKSKDTRYIALVLRGHYDVDRVVADLSPHWDVRYVQRISPPEPDKVFSRFVDQFTKLHVWNMEEFECIVYLDSDTLCVGDISPLFEAREAPFAAVLDYSDGNIMSTFNMGVFRVRPNGTEFARLTGLVRTKRDYRLDMAEQAFLNSVYGNAYEHLPFEYNANLAAAIQDKAYWETERPRTRIIHFTMLKPFDANVEQSGYYGACKVDIDVWRTERASMQQKSL